MTSSALPPRPCLAFLRELDAHVRSARTGNDVDHARDCANCTALLARMVRSVDLLAARPPVPTALHSRDLFDSILERAAESLATSPAGALLREGLALSPPVPEVPVPTMSTGLDLARRLAVSERAVPPWVWQRVRAEVRATIAERAARRRWRVARTILPLAFAAAMTLIAVSIWRPASDTEPEIVLQRLSAAPLVDFSPVAVLRRGAGE